MKKVCCSLYLFFVFALSCKAQVLPQDSIAVDDIMYATFGGHPSGPVSSWGGVTVTGDRITGLSIDGSSLMMGSGIMFTSSFGNLTALKTLALSGGGSTTYFGGFPASVVNCTSLESVSFSWMIMGGLTSLYNLPWLKSISYSGCFNGYFPPGIGNITSLERLTISGIIGGITIPDDIYNCRNLEYVNLTRNIYPAGLSSGIGRLTKLKYFNISGNEEPYTGTIPDSIGFCTQLRVLNLGGNNTFEGEIPASIVNCTQLSTFIAYGNWYGANTILENITSFQNLDTLDMNTTINQNPLQIPAGLSMLPHLSYLSLSGGGLIGNIPPSLGNSPALKTLSLSSGYFTGTIPTELGNIASLEKLSISSANITGGIPATIGNLSLLKSLSVTNCSLSEPLPATLTNLNPTTSINLSNNRLNFDGMEAAKQHFTGTFTVSPQPNISIRYNNVKLSVAAGGTLANNTYKWYRNGALFRTVIGDSTLATSQSGSYYVVVTNSIIASLLTLTSNTFRMPVKLCPPAAAATLTCTVTNTTYQWQANSGTGYVNISDNANFSGTNTQILQLNDIPSAWTGYSFRCMVGAAPFVYSGFEVLIQFQSQWGGSVSNSWENPANWNCNAVPDMNTDVVIPSGSVVINTNTTIRSLTVVSGATVTVSPGVTLTVLQ